jgi:branched-chain amino acid aminotransferase
LEVAAELGISVEFRSLPAVEITRVQELFISSTLRELVPVTRVDGHVVSSGVPGPVTRRLIGALRYKILASLERG